MNYRENPALGGTDIRAMVSDYEAWLFERKLKLAGELPPWLERKSSPAAEFGTLVHMAILEPWLYDANAVVMPYFPNHTIKIAKDAKRKAEEEAKSRGDGFVVRHEHAWAIEQIRANINGLPKPEPGATEIELYAEHYGVKCKGKIDWLAEVKGELYLIDVKTISDFHKRGDVLFRNHYHCQLAHYSNLLEYRRPWREAILWVESVPPYRTEFQEVESSVMELARTAWCTALQRYANEGKETGPFG